MSNGNSNNFYIIYIGEGIENDDLYKKVEKKMNLAIDWYRSERGFWVIYSSSDAQKWYERLRIVKDAGVHVFICRLDISDRQGWMPKDFWSWVRKRASN